MLLHSLPIIIKTAVSIPDKLFQNAEQTAKKLGIPRSQLFAKALEEFISNHKKDRIIEKLKNFMQKSEYQLPLLELK